MSQQPDPLQTPLHDLHLQLGAKMVTFAGYRMPVSYPAGIMAEHRSTRSSAGLFDVSHMGQIEVRGKDCATLLESEFPSDLEKLRPGRQKYTLLLTDEGGIRDDLMAINRGDHFLLVVNAACKAADLEYLGSRLGDRLELSLRDDLALLALQGPEAATVLTSLGADASALGQMKFLHVADLCLDGQDCVVSRSGYSGEDGFEISVSADAARGLAEAMLAHPAVSPAGLGARDSLRLEAGLCLYGQDLDTETSPVEAGLSWAISPARRAGGERAGGFPGAGRILRQLEAGCERRLVGLQPEGRAPMRSGTALHDADGQSVGTITSGGFGPSVERPVSMGYVLAEYAENGTRLTGEVRGRHLPVEVAGLPFVTRNYVR
jgi:aminomethyltransferase